MKSVEKSLRSFVVTVELIATYLAEDENEAWDKAMADLGQHNAMNVTDHWIWEDL